MSCQVEQIVCVYCLVSVFSIGLSNDQLYRVTGQILSSLSEQTVELARTFDVSSRTACTSEDSCILRSTEFPRVTVVHTSINFSIGELFDACEIKKDELPEGLCIEPDGDKPTRKLTQYLIDIYADNIVSKGFINHVKPADNEINMRLAKAIVVLNLRGPDEAIVMLDSILKDWPAVSTVRYCRAVATLRKFTQNKVKLKQALDDINTIIEQENGEHNEFYSRRAEIYLSLQNYEKAIADLSRVIESNPSAKFYFLRGLLRMTLQYYTLAVEDFKMVGDKTSPWYTECCFHLGLSLYYRGKLRNAIEVFKDVLRKQPDHIAASIALSQAFRELGNIAGAWSRFNQTVMSPTYNDSVLIMKLLGDMFYLTGDAQRSLLYYERCLFIDIRNIPCRFMSALAHASLGSFFSAVKLFSQVVILHVDSGQSHLSSEFLKSLYLREVSRYLHSHLDGNLAHADMDRELENNFKEGWLKMDYLGNNLKEQPAIQPEIAPVTLAQFTNLPPTSQTVVCRAMKIGSFAQVQSDGFTPNRRRTLAMGLAVLHVAQFMAHFWKNIRENNAVDKSPSWRDIVHVAVLYDRLVCPEYPVLWIEQLSKENLSKDYCVDINLVMGSVVNFRVIQYFRIITRLVMSTLEHSSRSDVQESMELIDDVGDEETVCDMLLDVIKKTMHQSWFVITSRVPAGSTGGDRLDGVIIVLRRGDKKGSQSFSLQVRHTEKRSRSYDTELTRAFTQLQEDVKRTGRNKAMDIDILIKRVLTIVYYFCNLMPLTRDTSIVAYAVALGLLMSHDYEVIGKIPSGKLLEFEAMFAGSPESFVSLTRQWMQIRTSSPSILSLPTVWKTFPTIRSLLEVLHIPPTVC